MPRSLQYEILVNNLVLCSWHGELPLCWCQAIEYMLNLFCLHLALLLGSGWLGCLPLSGSSGLHTPTVLCSYLLQVVYT